MNSTTSVSPLNGGHQAPVSSRQIDHSDSKEQSAGDGSRPSQPSRFGSSFGSGSSAWNQGGIWGSNGSFSINNDNMYTNNSTNSFDDLKGSSSLVPSSQTDPWKDHNNLWSNSGSRPTTSSNARPNGLNSSSQSMDSVTRPTTGIHQNGGLFGSSSFSSTSNGTTSRKSQLDPTSGSFAWGNGLDIGGLDNTRNKPINALGLNHDSYVASPLDSEAVQPERYTTSIEASRNSSAAASRSGSIPPLRNNNNQSPGGTFGHQIGMNQQSNGQRNFHSSRNSVISSNSYSNRPESAGYDPTIQLTSSFGGMNMSNGEGQTQQDFGRSQFLTDSRQPSGARNARFGGHTPSYGNGAGSYTPSGYADRSSDYASSTRGLGAFDSQTGRGHLRNVQNQQYSANGASPIPTDSYGTHSRGSTSSAPSHSGMQMPQANILDSKLRGLQHEQRNQPYFYPSSPNPLLMRNDFSRHHLAHNPYGYNMADSMGYPHYMGGVHNARNMHLPPRGPARDVDNTSAIMSPLMHDFKSNSKTSKRFELKDLYGHIVEFSGDQHGSRFIQQKLETANSDDKEQVFREIKPNALQLMTDVFGNYVIQKFFEHGNQNQKSLLAEQMKGHVLSLSLQMYGCRVVQKALEHILLAQQISFVKELQTNIMKCIQDQNGNHVVQKAIERVPQEHIQFVVEAVSGKVHPLAIHNYGCRVVQRLLEHTDEATQLSLLRELHACTYNLVLDPYGNYVVQHILANGKPEDQAKVIDVVATNVMTFSKNKCGSNVVERCMKTASKEQLAQILANVVGPTADRANSLSLMKDQFGNYVIQSILHILKGQQLEEFVEVIHMHLASLKKLNYGNGKQIAAIEKVISTLDIPRNHTPPPESSAEPTPPLTSFEARSLESGSQPSTANSTIDGPVTVAAPPSQVKDQTHTEVKLVAIS